MCGDILAFNIVVSLVKTSSSIPSSTVRYFEKKILNALNVVLDVIFLDQMFKPVLIVLN